MVDPVIPPATGAPAPSPTPSPTPAPTPAPSPAPSPAPDAKPDEKPAERKTLEQKLADQKAKPDDKKPAEGEKKPDAKPDDIAIKLPEGVKVDEKQLGAFKDVSKELGLKSEGAQKLFDMYSKVEAEKAKAAQAADDEQQDKWEAEILKWPDAEEKLALAKTAISKLANDNAKAFFQVPFVGSNPDIVQFLAAVGKLMREAPLHESNGGGSKTFTAQDIFKGMNP